MGIKKVEESRWSILYEQAVKDYVEAVKNHAVARSHLRRLDWLDRKLREEYQEE